MPKLICTMRKTKKFIFFLVHFAISMMYKKCVHALGSEITKNGEYSLFPFLRSNVVNSIDFF